MRISLRDLFWLVVLVALGVSWYVERRQIQEAAANASPTRFQRQPSRISNRTVARELEIVQAVRELSNEQLVAHYSPDAKGHPAYEAFLLELSRRKMSGELRTIYTAAQQTPTTDPNLPPGTPNSATSWNNCVLLTALRRAEGNPDPIRIDIQSLGTNPLRSATASPFILSRITNVDVERERFFVECGSDFAERWQFRLKNARGELVPRLERNFTDYGGMSLSGMLPFGKTDDSTQPFDIRDYLVKPPPGRYTLELLHGNWRFEDGDPLDSQSLSSRFVWKSAPIPVIVAETTLPSKWEAIRLPLAFAVAVIVLGIAALVELCLVQPAPNSAIFQRRDLIFLNIILFMAASWSWDSLLLLQSFEHLELDSKSSWTIQLVQATKNAT